MNLKDKKVLIVGYGKSGQSVVEKALQLGSEIWVYDDKLEASVLASEKIKQFKYQPLNPQPSTLNPGLVVSSPGIPFDHPVLRLAAKNNWPVISEIEFGYQLLKPDFIIGITGTNGKTTVVELLAHIFKLSGRPFTVAGNIGTPLTSLDKVEGTLILELSSFQLHFIDKFRANVGVILNVTEDHLDWHCCFGQYLRDKLRIFENQDVGNIALLNSDDQALGNEKLKTKNEKLQLKDEKELVGKVKTFSVRDAADYGLKEGYLTAYGENILSVEDLKLKGAHNLSNILAVMACAREAGLDWEPIIEGLKTFNGLKHRLQFVTSKQGVSFYNDSKSTNPDSTRKAVEAFDEPLVLIMGGRNKGNNFGFLKDYMNSRIKELIIYGEAANEIKSHIGEGIVVKSVEDALDLAVQKADSSDIVLFSPGCSSFDLFNGYAQRGDVFIAAVEALNG